MGVLSRSAEIGVRGVEQVAGAISTRASTEYIRLAQSTSEVIKSATGVCGGAGGSRSATSSGSCQRLQKCQEALEKTLTSIQEVKSVEYCKDMVLNIHVQISEVLEIALATLKPTAEQGMTTVDKAVVSPLINLLEQLKASLANLFTVAFSTVDDNVATPVFDRAIQALCTTKNLSLKATAWADNRLYLGKAVDTAKTLSKCLDRSFTGGMVENKLVAPAKNKVSEYDHWLLDGSLSGLVNEFKEVLSTETAGDSTTKTTETVITPATATPKEQISSGFTVESAVESPEKPNLAPAPAPEPVIPVCDSEDSGFEGPSSKKTGGSSTSNRKKKNRSNRK